MNYVIFMGVYILLVTLIMAVYVYKAFRGPPGYDFDKLGK